MAMTVSTQMEQILNEYSEEVQDAANRAIEKVARECAKRLKMTSPKKSGSYAKGWSVKRTDAHGSIASLVVYNRTDYQLTHLLENGHVVRNKKGTYGYAPPKRHIKPVEEWGNSELPNEIERQLP